MVMRHYERFKATADSEIEVTPRDTTEEAKREREKKTTIKASDKKAKTKAHRIRLMAELYERKKPPARMAGEYLGCAN